MIYISVFFISSILFFLSGKCRGVLNWLLAGMGIAILCLLAGMRDETVGIDVLSYAKWMCIDAQNLSFFDFIKHEAPVAGLGWNVFTWLAVRLTGGMTGYLACIELMCVVPVFMLLRHWFSGNEWQGMLTWMLLQYPFTYNGMRQAIAMSICTYSLRYVRERNFRKFILFVIVAYLFHQTALVFLIIYLFELMRNERGALHELFGKWQKFVVTTAIMLSFVILFFMAPSIVISASSFKDSYAYQLNHLGESDFSIAGLYLLLLSLLMSYLCSDDFESKSEEQTFSFITDVVTYGAIAWQLNLVTPTLGRLGYYGTMLFCVEAGLLASSKKRKTSGHLLILIIFSLAYFIVMTLVQKKSGVYPYTSSILGIE